MSLFSLGAEDVTPEQQQFKNKLSDRDSQIAAQQTQLLRLNIVLEETKASLDDALHKLHQETNRVLQLEKDLCKCSEDFRNEQILAQNREAAVSVANERLKAKDLEMKHLEATLQSISHQSDENTTREMKVSKEKGVLEARVKELEANLRMLSSPPMTPKPPTRGRSSSLSNVRILTLENELNGLRANLAQKETDLCIKDQKILALQQEMVKVDNEKMALEKRVGRELEDMRKQLEERDEELDYLRSAQGNGEREEELLQRIEEDDAKIAMLEAMVGEAQDTKALKGKLRSSEQKAEAEVRRAAESESRNVELLREKEEVLHDLANAREKITSLTQALSDKEACIQRLENTTPSPDPSHDLSHVERLLAAVQRLRNERDGLRRDVQFLQSESQFTVEALEAKVAAASQSNAEIEALRAQLDEIRATDEAKTRRIDQLTNAFSASAVVIQHLHSNSDSSQEPQFDDSPIDMRQKLEITMQCLEETTDQRNDLMSRLDCTERELNDQLAELKLACQEAKDVAENLDGKLSEASNALEQVESERDSLSVQVANLTIDLEKAQQELSDAESRYSSLQFHQLSNMSADEATQALKEQIEELEMRVLRRTEQIGVHQHDIRRMETNLRLQEDRLMEMTTEMETLAAQKEAMVEDCADARDARDEALAKVDKLEVDVEALEGRLQDSDNALEAMVQVILQALGEHRGTVQSSKTEMQRISLNLQALTSEHTDALERLQKKVAECEELETRLGRAEVDVETAALLQGRLAELQERYEAQCADTKSLTIQLQNLREEKARSCTEIGELEAKISELDQLITDMHNKHETVVLDLQRRLQEKTIADDDSEHELVQMKVKHIEELGSLQSRLVETSSALEEALAQHAALESTYQESLSEATRIQNELQERLRNASDAAELHKKALDDQLHVQESQKQEVAVLKEQLAKAEDEDRKARQSLRQLEETLTERDQLHALELEKHQSQVDQLSGVVAELEQNLISEGQKSKQLSREITCLQEELQEQRNDRNKEQTQYESAVQALSEQSKRSESMLHSVKDELLLVQKELEDRQRDFETVEEERTVLQQEITALEAEGQRLRSLIRHLERQIQDSDSRILSLSAELELSQQNLAQAERTGNTAEVNLNLLGAQHRREMSQIQRELDALKSKPSLEKALLELEERNNEMEEVLRQKCREIEENDDRVLEMLKDNKKLTAKTEALTRKVQNLQAKLAAAKATAEAESSPKPNDVPTSRPRSNTFASPALPVPPLSRDRIASGPSSLPRPKTPDRKLAPLPAVFKSRSPDKRSDALPVPPVTGKKRPAPEDFPAIPAKGFTAECVPQPVDHINDTEVVEGTPRRRRVLSTLQSGFTPIRQNRPMISLPSPKRAEVKASPFMSDVTNTTDHTEKPFKRSWLGKIRGVSTAPGRTFQ